jgi:hypothetical protein
VRDPRSGAVVLREAGPCSSVWQLRVTPREEGLGELCWAEKAQHGAPRLMRWRLAEDACEVAQECPEWQHLPAGSCVRVQGEAASALHPTGELELWHLPGGGAPAVWVGQVATGMGPVEHWHGAGRVLARTSEVDGGSLLGWDLAEFVRQAAMHGGGAAEGLSKVATCRVGVKVRVGVGALGLGLGLGLGLEV